MSNRKVDTQEIYEKRRMQDGKQAKEKIPMKPESRSKLFACLAYIPFVWIVSYFAERKNEFVRFHVKQGMKLTLLTLVVGAVAWALNAFFSWIFSYSVPTPTPEDLSHVTTGVNSVGHYCSFCGHHYIAILCFVRRDCSSKRKNGRIAFIRKTKT